MLICIKCLIDMRPEKNNVLVARDPYCVQHADLYKCPECGVKVLTGAGSPFEYQLANRIYKGAVWRDFDMYTLDIKTIREAEAVDVG